MEQLDLRLRDAVESRACTRKFSQRISTTLGVER